MKDKTLNIPSALRSFLILLQGMEDTLRGQAPQNGCSATHTPGGYVVELGASALHLPHHAIDSMRANLTARELSHLTREVSQVLHGLFVLACQDYVAKRARQGRMLLTHVVQDEHTTKWKMKKPRRLLEAMGKNARDEDQLRVVSQCLTLLRKVSMRMRQERLKN